MQSQKKETRKRKSEPIEYEKFIKVKCPHCSSGVKRKNHIYLDLPWHDLPDTLLCYACGEVIDISKLKTEGVEITRR